MMRQNDRWRVKGMPCLTYRIELGVGILAFEPVSNGDDVDGCHCEELALCLSKDAHKCG